MSGMAQPRYWQHKRVGLFTPWMVLDIIVWEVDLVQPFPATKLRSIKVAVEEKVWKF